MAAFGRFVLFLHAMVSQPERGPVLWQRTLEEAVDIGVKSVIIVGMVAAFTGTVTCVQIAYNLTNSFVPISRPAIAIHYTVGV